MKIFFVFIIIITISDFCVSQNKGFLVAGEMSSPDSTYSIVYRNITDTITPNEGIFGSHYDLHGVFNFDLNNDYINDYYFYVFRNGFTAMSVGGSVIVPFNNNYFSISINDTATANILNFGDSINNNLLWSNDTMLWPTSYLSYFSGGWQLPTIVAGLWFHQSDKFLPLKMIVNSDTLFGWIRIDVPIYSEIIVKDFAVKIKNTSGINEIQNKIIKLYPNPVLNSLTVEIPQTIGERTLTICNLNGQELIKKKLVEDVTNIDVNILPRGMYFIKLITNKTIEINKIIKE